LQDVYRSLPNAARNCIALRLSWFGKADRPPNRSERRAVIGERLSRVQVQRNQKDNRQRNAGQPKKRGLEI
jgi:hypothetical protein